VLTRQNRIRKTAIVGKFQKFATMRNRFCIGIACLALSGSAIGSSASSLSSVDYAWPQAPGINDHALHVLTSNLLELRLINTKAPDPAPLTNWNFVKNGSFASPNGKAFAVTANGKSVKVSSVNFKRRPFYGPLYPRDLRIENSLYLSLASPISDGQVVEVKNPNGQLWSSNIQFTNTVDPLRYSPAIHVNQEGYLPNYTKQAMVGYYAGDLGEVSIPATLGFKLVNAASGQQVYTGSLVRHPDTGYTYTPAPYQQVYVADFSSFNTPGEYQLVVPTLGASLPFLINDGIFMSFTRAYSLGLYHQRCGTATSVPYTRFTHGICHSAPASVPTSATAFPFTWNTVSNYAVQSNPDNPVQTAPSLTSPASQLFPFVNQGPTVSVSGGHHDAGDYSKYTINSASLIHFLTFEVDSMPGVAALDNLGIPESHDGISDLMQEAKWEADFLAKMQDADGGFYFLVYPQNREYENNVTPDNGDPQVVWPKNTAATAAAVAGLAQIASSPLFKQTYPTAAAAYLQKAQLGWQFLTNAVARFGKNGAYQKITSYGDDFADNDELAWAACQIFLATGDANAHQLLLSWFDPADPSTWRWGWWHMSECYGNAIRSYAFAVQSGRVPGVSSLNATFLRQCQAQIAQAGDDALQWSLDNAYASSFPDETKRFRAAGWYFSTDQALDMAVAYQLNAKPAYLDAILGNLNFESGCNPVNVSYVSGLGWKRSRNLVSQWAANAPRSLPPSGLPMGNIEQQFYYLYTYNTDLEALCYPSDTANTAPYPFYDRWGDIWNVSTEMVNLNSARSLGTLAFLAARGQPQAWQAPAAQITVPSTSVKVGTPIVVTLQAPSGLDLSSARIVWEGLLQQPIYGTSSFTFTPQVAGAQWVEVEAQLSDGRRVFAQGSFSAN
jgi:hypothetical protein